MAIPGDGLLQNPKKSKLPLSYYLDRVYTEGHHLGKGSYKWMNRRELVRATAISAKSWYVWLRMCKSSTCLNVMRWKAKMITHTKEPHCKQLM